MRKQESGFTLIELIVVIALLGILVAVALPKYIDLTEKAKQAHDEGMLGGLRSATALLYSSNVLYTVTNSIGTYWPTYAQVTNQMTDPVAATNWLYFTNVTYSPTNGTWTALY